MNRDRLIRLIDRLVMAHSPSGNEQEVDSIIIEEFRTLSDDVWQDQAGNIVALLRGRSSEGAICLTGHKDEIGMIVSGIDEDGALIVKNIGGAYPWVYGEGVVDVLGDNRTISGVLSAGSRHTLSEHMSDLKMGEKGLSWDMVWIETKMKKEELEKAGVHVGSKVVIGKHRKRPFVMGDYICGYGLDCKAAVTILVGIMENLKGEDFPVDVYLVASSSEEIGAIGAVYSARTLPVDEIIAVEVGPVLEEFGTTNSPHPILLYQDRHVVYSERINASLAKVAEGLGLRVQRACVSSFGSDASYANKYGAAAAAACVCYPAENTHGYEICSVEGILNVGWLLSEYLKKAVDSKQ